MTNDEIIEEAISVLYARHLANENTAGGVAAALITDYGTVYRGVCIDTSSGMGFCAEHAAIAAMITSGESQIVKVVAVTKDDHGTIYVLPPCGRCREFMRQINDANLDAEVVLGKESVVTLRELLPYHREPAPLV